MGKHWQIEKVLGGRENGQGRYSHNYHDVVSPHGGARCPVWTKSKRMSLVLGRVQAWVLIGFRRANAGHEQDFEQLAVEQGRENNSTTPHSVSC
eukprot:g27748.t1